MRRDVRLGQIRIGPLGVWVFCIGSGVFWKFPGDGWMYLEMIGESRCWVWDMFEKFDCIVCFVEGIGG